MSKLSQWFYDRFHKIDVDVNETFDGDKKQTISARWGRRTGRGDCKACRFACLALNFITRQKRHCEEAAESFETKNAKEQK